MDCTGNIGICVGAFLIRWDDLYTQMQQQIIQIDPGDDVNVFINFEPVLRNISMRKNIASDISNYKKEICIELESAILNLVAHYRSYFKIKHKANPNIYLYYTDLASETDQQMTSFNKYYRSYYKNRYLHNPQFKEMGNLLTKIIIPEVSLILSYVPGCYFITSKNFDSSIVPKIISRINEYKNVVISGDIFDTLYMHHPEFIVIYIKRRYQYFKVFSSVESTVQSIIKNESPFDLTIFNSKMYYRLLLAIKGSKIRNIKAAKSFGYSKFIKILSKGMDNGIVLKDFSSVDSILELFPEQYRDDIKNAFICTSIETQIELINDIDIEEIKKQIIDRIDTRSVEALNNKRFLDCPINLQYLLY